MRYFFLLSCALILAGCSSSEKLLEEAAPPKSMGQQTSETPIQTPEKSPVQESNKPMYQNPPALSIDQNKKYTATIKTDKGDIGVELFADKTPITVNNFVFLAREKFYDGVIFHRTIPGFMVQGGDPTGTGMGGPGYSNVEKPVEEIDYSRGAIAMAKKGNEPAGTFGSQFFIMHKDTPLPKDYVIFGRVTSGLDVVDAIATAPTAPGGEGSKPQNPVVMQSVSIREE